jgi:hypothetical protein
MEANVSNVSITYKKTLREWPKTYIDPLLNGQKLTLNGQKLTLTSGKPRQPWDTERLKIGKKLT